MKKILLNISIILLISLSSYSQSVRITSLIEGDCPTSGDTAPRVIELYVDGTVNVTDLKIQFQFSYATNWVVNNNIGVGEYTDTFLYVVNDIDAFDNNFPGIRTPENTTIGTILSDVEGGEKIRLVDSSNDNEVVDIFGIDGENGENTTWNFSNSYAKRNDNAGPSSTFIESNWTITPKNTLLFEGVCWDEPALNTIVGLGSFTLSTTDFTFNSTKSSVYPNPSSEFIKIDGIVGTETFQIYNILGVNVLNGLTENNKEIQIKNLKSGIYIIKTETGKVFKFVKK